MPIYTNKNTVANRRLAKKRVQCLNQALCFVSSSVLADSLVLRNPLLRQAPNVRRKQNNPILIKKLMRQIFILFTALGFLVSCNNSNSTKALTDTTIVNHQDDNTSKKSERQIIIEEIKRLQTIFASNNKEKIADIFRFPLSQTKVGIYIEDSTFNAQLKRNGDKTTRAMFLRYFPEISESLQINELNNLFKNINAGGLQKEDTLKYEALIKAEPCYHIYSIRLEKDLVTLTVGTDSNKDYNNKTVLEDEIPENSSEICEHMLWWVFRFNGNKLELQEISGAG